MGEFVQTVNDSASSDLGKSLSYSLGALAEFEYKAQEIESAQARADPSEHRGRACPPRQLCPDEPPRVLV